MWLMPRPTELNKSNLLIENRRVFECFWYFDLNVTGLVFRAKGFCVVPKKCFSFNSNVIILVNFSKALFTWKFLITVCHCVVLWGKLIYLVLVWKLTLRCHKVHDSLSEPRTAPWVKSSTLSSGFQGTNLLLFLLLQKADGCTKESIPLQIISQYQESWKVQTH